jgi:hypothetical protein
MYVHVCLGEMQLDPDLDVTCCTPGTSRAQRRRISVVRPLQSVGFKSAVPE